MHNRQQMGFDFPSEDSIYRPTPRDEALINLRYLREVNGYVEATTPRSIAYYLREYVFNPFEEFTQEEMHVVMLNARMIITHDAMVYRGTIDAIGVRIAELFRPAIYCNANSIIVAHCHPSGRATPSPEDVRSTERMIEAGEILGIPVMDHLVIGKNEWVSLRDKGLAFK